MTSTQDEIPEVSTVLHVFSGDLWAGPEVVIFNLLSQLNGETGLRVLALSLNEGILTQKLRAAGVTTYVIPEARHSFLGIVFRAARLLRHVPITTIHSHRYKENLLAWLLAKWLGVTQVITTIHGLPEPVSHAAGAERLTRWRAQLDYLVLKRGFDRAVAVSEEMKRVLVHSHGFRQDQIRVIRNGRAFPAPSTLAAPARKECFHIGTVARMVPVKGLDLFLDVAAALQHETRFIRFSLLGDGPLRDELVRKAVSLRLGDRVEFLTPRPDPFPYYRTLDLYLNTSLHEGSPLSVIEAMACGTPVVLSAVGGIPEIVTHGEHGFLVRGRDASRFAERCLELMRDENLRRTMGERAAALARSRFSASGMVRAYRHLYDECTPRSRVAGLGTLKGARGPRQSHTAVNLPNVPRA